MRSIFIPFVLTVLFTAQIKMTMAQTEKKEAPTLLNHIAVYVADLQKATVFYETVFGLKQIPEPFKDGKHTWFTLGAAGQLHIIAGAKQNISYEKNNHLCFSVPSVDEFVLKLKTKGVAFENWAGVAGAVTKRVDGIKQIYFKDPDGHWLEVNDDYR